MPNFRTGTDLEKSPLFYISRRNTRQRDKITTHANRIKRTTHANRMFYYGSRFSTGRLLAIEDFTFVFYQALKGLLGKLHLPQVWKKYHTSISNSTHLWSYTNTAIANISANSTRSRTSPTSPHWVPMSPHWALISPHRAPISSHRIHVSQCVSSFTMF